LPSFIFVWSATIAAASGDGMVRHWYYTRAAETRLRQVIGRRGGDEVMQVMT